MIANRPANTQAQDSGHSADAPLVSILLPILNEAADIAAALERISDQTFSDFEVLIADGGSTDETLLIVQRRAKNDDRFRVLHNPRKLQSAGLNTALAECRGQFLVRLDGHTFVEADYVQRCVDLLQETGAGVVGGRMLAQPVESAVGKGIALANQSPWGAGPAKFHAGARSGPAETVYLGAFRTSVVRQLGGWAEDVGVNEDYELNHRIANAGHLVWLDVDLAAGYRPRSSFKALATQYFRYGRSKAAVMKRHPDSVKLRQVLPSLLVPVAAGMLLRPLRILGGLGVGTHTLVVITGATRTAAPPQDRVIGALAALVMHWCWSGGFWFGLVRRFPPAVPLGSAATPRSSETGAS